MKVRNYWAVRLGLILVGVISMVPTGVGMSREQGSNHYLTQVDSTLRSGRPIKHKHAGPSKNSRTVRRGGTGTTHSIIFVGGKRTGSTKSNPRQTKKVQGALNPQPIPPGKKRHPPASK